MRFTKMQGIGNDYVYLDCTRTAPEDPQELSRRMADRHFGIGSDGLVLILPGGPDWDYEMRMFNADGSEAEMCGNASRCVGKYVHDRGLTEKTEIRLKTGAGIKTLRLETDGGGRTFSVCVDMGAPVLEPGRIPTRLKSTAQYEGCGAVIGGELRDGEESFRVTCVSMGNPHCVLFVPDAEGTDVEKKGRRIENHPAFPEKTNVEFATVLDSGRIRMRVWERGSGETMACGTGACATLTAAVLNGLTARRATLMLNGGELDIRWDEKTGHILMTGPAEFVFDGEWPETAE